jgi:hypothetical protein
MQISKAYILGCGSFGSRAFKLLQPRLHKGGIVVIDHQYQPLEKIIARGGNTMVMDAISFLASSQEKLHPDDWIVPAVPIHAAFEWIHAELSSRASCRIIPVPEPLDDLLPNTIRGADGQLYASNADFICPHNCPEPDDHCTVTHEPRPQVLCDTLARLNISGYHSVCIVSSQLAPGVGGFQRRTLLRALEEIQAHPGKVLVSTACKCHGVVHAFKYRVEQQRSQEEFIRQD